MAKPSVSQMGKLCLRKKAHGPDNTRPPCRRDYGPPRQKQMGTHLDQDHLAMFLCPLLNSHSHGMTLKMGLGGH